MYNYKPRPLRSEPYLEFVRSLPCVVCGNPETVAHHLIGAGHGGKTGGKASDLHTLSLCVEHHNELHDKGAREWEERYGKQSDFIILTQNYATAALWGWKPPGGLR